MSKLKLIIIIVVSLIVGAIIGAEVTVKVVKSYQDNINQNYLDSYYETNDPQKELPFIIQDASSTFERFKLVVELPAKGY